MSQGITQGSYEPGLVFCGSLKAVSLYSLQNVSLDVPKWCSSLFTFVLNSLRVAGQVICQWWLFVFSQSGAVGCWEETS